MPEPVSWVHAFVDVPIEHRDRAREFWSAVTGWPVGREWDGHPEFVSIEPPDGAPYLHVQTIDGPARVHLDLRGDPETDPDRLVNLGAQRTHPGDGWQAMRSPAGLAFCVCSESWPHRRPGATTWPAGHRSRLVQLCIDVPASSYDAELAFWRAATGWADESVDDPTFSRLVHRAKSPLQLLVQRLGADDPDENARAHLDLGASDIPAEATRLSALGATVVRSDQDGITILRDPVGLLFCVTSNDPDR